MAKRKRRIKQKGRFARFSGETTKFVNTRNTGVIDKDGKDIYVPVGPIKLPSHVVNVGRGPNQERMQQYYNAVKPESFLEPLKLRTGPQMFKWLQEYVNVLKETPINNRITLAEGPNGRLDLFFAQSAKEWFFVEIDYSKVYIRYSRKYTSKKTALDRLSNQRVTWEGYLTQESLPPPVR
jgi:hypothetical protein